jgi:hypothetical protein
MRKTKIISRVRLWDVTCVKKPRSRRIAWRGAHSRPALVAHREQPTYCIVVRSRVDVKNLRKAKAQKPADRPSPTTIPHQTL